MRHEEQLLTDVESQAVIEEINAWCRRTGTNYNKLVTAARVAPSTRSDVRNRGRRLTIQTAMKLRTAMRANRKGIVLGEHKARVRRIAQESLDRQRAKLKRDFPATPLKVDRTPCPRCGVRRDVGCVHHAKF